MASTRVVTQSLLRGSVCRQCGRFPIRRQYAQRTPRPRLPSKGTTTWTAIVPARWHSTPASVSKVYEFEQMKAISSEASPDRILIDVREPAELEEGYIPGAINLPIKSQPDAIFLPEEEFEDRFGFSKPEKDKEVIFYCKAGVRASAAAQLAEQYGYKHVAEYRGSMLDWHKNNGPLQRK